MEVQGLMPDRSTGIGDRLRSVRKRRGLSQAELAELSGVSLSLIRKLEQGERGDVRVETLRKLAAAMEVATTTLIGQPPEPVPEGQPDAIWVPSREAILHPQPGTAPEPVTDRGLSDALTAAVGLYHDNEYDRLALALPRLLTDAEDTSPLLRSRVYQLAGSVMVQTRQRDAAKVALDRSLADAQAAGDLLDAASAVITMCWLLLLERRFEEVRHLAAEWADRVEPRISAATTRELSVWGWLLLRGSAAAIRDNRPGEAADMMRLAQAAAVAAGREMGGYRMYWTTFGPSTVAMKRVENAVVDGRPDVALRLARQVPQGLRPTSDNRNRHLLDVSAAHLDMHHYDEALGVLDRLRHEAGPWLAEQGMARRLLAQIIDRRRTLTPEMRELAGAVRLEL
jgi:transcriptional regulator with XRE-family HTH domain